MNIDFEKEFDSTILMRGFSIYAQGNVSNVKKDGDVISAVVYGSYNYNVQVEIVSGKYLKGGCSCPYSEGHFNCKHIAALLYYLINNNTFETAVNESDLSAIINKIPTNLLKEFLIDTLSENSKLYDRFRVEFIDYFNPLTKEEYRKRIYDSISNCAGRYGYIDYENAWEYTHNMYEFTNEAEKLIKRGNYDLAFDIVSVILESIPDTEIDDSNGSTGEVAEECIEIIRNILNCNANEDKKLTYKIFDFIIEELKTEDLSNYGIELYELISYFIENRIFLEEVEQSLLEVLDDNINKDYFYKAKYYVDYLIDIYKFKNEENKIKDLLKKYSNEKEIFLKYMDLLISEHSINEAINLLKERIKKDVKEYRVRDLEEYLMNVYYDNNMMEDYKEQLYKLFFKYQNYDLGTYNKIKELYNKEDWKKEKLNIIAELNKSNAKSIIYNIYVEEGMFDELFIAIKDKGMDVIKHYDQYLQPKYNKELIKIYVDECRNKAQRVNNRSNYRALAYDIRYLTKIKGSNESVTNLLEEINKLYFRNRPAMKDEFNQVLDLKEYNY